MSGLGMKYVASFINSFARRIKNMGDDITRTVTVMLGFMFVFALIFGGLSLRDLNSSWNHSVETREKLAECVDSGWHFILQQYAMVIGVNGVGVCTLEMYTDSALSKLVFETCTGFGTSVSGHITTTFLMHKFYDADSIHSKYSVIEYAEILNVLERMQMIGEEVLS